MAELSLGVNGFGVDSSEAIASVRDVEPLGRGGSARVYTLTSGDDSVDR